MDLKILKKEYDVLAKKHKLPNFHEINEPFDIEKIDRESLTLLKQVRKVMMEKVVNILGFVEMLLNPMNAPRVYLVYFKSMSAEDKKILEKIYSIFSDLTLASLECEINYSEKNEADIIKNIYNEWNNHTNDLNCIVANIRKPHNNDVQKERTYFG